MLEQLKKLGTSGGVGAVIGIILVIWIEPTTSAGIGVIIAVCILISSVAGAGITALFNNKQNGA